MFKRFLERKDRTPGKETKEDRKLRLIVETAIEIDKKIKAAEEKQLYIYVVYIQSRQISSKT